MLGRVNKNFDYSEDFVMGLLSVAGKWGLKAAKYVAKHPEQALGVVNAGKEIINSIRKKQALGELDPQVAELLIHVDNLEREFETYKRESTAYQEKLEKTFLRVAILEGVAIIVAIVLAIVL